MHFCKSWLVIVSCGTCVFSAHSATSLFSDYGQIQNVQNYSSNPFWNPNSPYNQKLPQPVYVQGAALNADDCIKAVYYLVSVQCMVRDNCQNTSLSDIRPEIMVQLSKLPGNNYVSSCAGYIDTAYESYVAQYTVQNVQFPKAQVKQNVNIQNPYKTTAQKWQQGINERRNELQQLQQQNGAGREVLSSTEFPTTYDDLSFSSKMQLMTEGYEPFKDKSAYKEINVQSKAKWCAGEGRGTKECEEPKKDEPVKPAAQVCSSTSCSTDASEPEKTDKQPTDKATQTTDQPVTKASSTISTTNTTKAGKIMVLAMGGSAIQINQTINLSTASETSHLWTTTGANDKCFSKGDPANKATSILNTLITGVTKDGAYHYLDFPPTNKNYFNYFPGLLLKLKDGKVSIAEFKTGQEARKFVDNIIEAGADKAPSETKTANGNIWTPVYGSASLCGKLILYVIQQKDPDKMDDFKVLYLRRLYKTDYEKTNIDRSGSFIYKGNTYTNSAFID